MKNKHTTLKIKVKKHQIGSVVLDEEWKLQSDLEKNTGTSERRRQETRRTLPIKMIKVVQCTCRP